MAKDLVEAITELLRAACAEAGDPPPSDRALRSWAQKLHTDMGGTRPYFPKAPALGKALRLGQQLAAGVPLDQAFANVGMSRATGFRVLGRPWRLRR